MRNCRPVLVVQLHTLGLVHEPTFPMATTNHRLTFIPPARANPHRNRPSSFSPCTADARMTGKGEGQPAEFVMAKRALQERTSCLPRLTAQVLWNPFSITPRSTAACGRSGPPGACGPLIVSRAESRELVAVTGERGRSIRSRHHGLAAAGQLH